MQHLSYTRGRFASDSTSAHKPPSPPPPYLQIPASIPLLTAQPPASHTTRKQQRCSSNSASLHARRCRNRFKMAAPFTDPQCNLHLRRMVCVCVCMSCGMRGAGSRHAAGDWIDNLDCMYQTTYSTVQGDYQRNEARF